MDGALPAAGASIEDVGRILAAQLAAFLALLLAAAALHKWLRWRRTLAAVRDFAGVPPALAPVAALLAGGAELLGALLLCVPAWRVPGALCAALVLVVYLALLVRARLSGRRDVDCGCSFGSARHASGGFELTRNILLAAAALGLAAASAAGGAPIAPSQLLGAAALLACYAALDQLMGLRSLRSGVAA